MRPQLYIREIPVKNGIVIRAVGFMGDNEIFLPLSKDEFMKCFTLWNNGAMIQDAFKCLTVVQWEFLMSGMSAEQQKVVFGKSEPEVNLN
jgi:hypothetical protein